VSANVYTLEMLQGGGTEKKNKTAILVTYIFLFLPILEGRIAGPSGSAV